jgi:hypothetical protein
MRTTFTSAEATEIRGLLSGLPQARLAVARMSRARLRRLGLGMVADPKPEPTLAEFESLVASGGLAIDEQGGTARAMTSPHPSGQIFKVAVGVTGNSVSADWSAFDQRYQWFGTHPKQVTSGAHLFVLAVDRWRSAVVGLYEAVSPGADKLPGSSDPVRWPWALGVRPLAAIPPPSAVRVDGQTGPQNGLPARIYDPEAQEHLYQAVAESPPPPGPQDLEQRVQELEWVDVVPDVLQAVGELGKNARGPVVVDRAIELGGWTPEELEARAWYTGSGVSSHLEHLISRALLLEQGSKGSLLQTHGVYSLQDPRPTVGKFGLTYRPAGDRKPEAEELPPHLADLSELDRATKRHMELQDRLAAALGERQIEPRSPGSWQPQFDLAFEHAGKTFVVEVKSGDPVSPQQMRLGTGQLLEYRCRLEEGRSEEISAALLIESAAPEPWEKLCGSLGIQILRADELRDSLAALLSDSD